jgi:glycosyltransferase involved in cell wall biosynthesis
MKIAHVVSTFPPHIGGMGRVVYEEVERLSKRNHEVAVFTLRYPNDIRDVEKDAMNRVSTIPFKVVHLKPLFRMGDGGEIPQLFFALQQADLIHLHYPFYGGEEWVLLAAKWFKKPYVVTYHMDAVLEGGVKKFLQAIYDYVWAWNVLKNAHTVIGIDRTHFLGTQFGQKLLNYRKCVEIKLGVDADIFKPSGVHANLPLLKDRDDKKIILFVGNLIPVKHLDTLLEAFKEVSFFETDVELVVEEGHRGARGRGL